MFALAGAHRSGKTTLAKALADKNGWEFVETNVSQVIKDSGVDVKADMPFAQRLDVQNAILHSMDVQFALRRGKTFVADRSPFDVVGYTLSEVLRSTLDDPAMLEKMDAHVRLARRLVYENLIAVMKVCPLYGTPTAEGKAQTNPYYMTHVDMAIERALADLGSTVQGFVGAVSNEYDLEARLKDADEFFGPIHKALRPEPKIWTPGS